MSKSLERILRAASSPLTPVPTTLAPRTLPLPDVRAVVFDIYGTLLISGSGDIGLADPTSRGAALQQALAAVGCHLNGAADGAMTALHEQIHQAHEQSRAAGTAFPEVDIVEIWRQTTDHLVTAGALAQPVPAQQLPQLAIEFETRVNPVWPMPDMTTTLAALQTAGLVLGIISNAQFFTPLLFPALVHKNLDQLGFDPELRYYSYVHRRAKPGPELYQLAAEGLAAKSIQPSAVLYVGNDMRNDIWPAAAVGFRTALFAGDQRSLRLRSAEADARAEPDVIVTQLPQIPPMLSSKL